MFDKCIFCYSKAQLTDEHIVPEFLGGSLTFRAVCKPCNDKMGSDFEGVAANSLPFRLGRFSNKITGKSNIPIVLFPQDGKTREGLKVSLDANMQPHLKPNITDVVNDGETSKLNFTIDASDRGELPRIVEAKVRRYAKKTWPNLSDEAVKDLVIQALSSIPQNPVIQNERPTIHYEESINLAALRILYMKIAFEISIYHHGISYLEDACAIELRTAINSRNDEPKIRGEVPIWDDPFKNIFRTKDTHLIVLMNNSCYIRLFDLVGIMQISEEKGNFNLGAESWSMYLFDYRATQYRHMRFIDYVKEFITFT
jgi:hypothetical protein